MSENTKEFKPYILTYDEWCERNNIKCEFELCDACYGSGNCIGNNEWDDVHDCHYCSECCGRGKVDITYNEFKRQLSLDMKKLERYKNSVQK